MGKKMASRMKTAALILSTAMSISLATLAAWKVGPEVSCNMAQDSNAFVRMSVGGPLTREVRKNQDALIRQMPFSGNATLLITVRVRSNGEVRIVHAKAREADSPEREYDMTSKVQNLLSLKKLNGFSDSEFVRREVFEFNLQNN